MLTREQIQFYFEIGYLLVDDVMWPEQLREMQDITRDCIDRSRGVTTRNAVYGLNEGHSQKTPKLTWIKLPHTQHPDLWNVSKNSGIADFSWQLGGPNAVLQKSKLNVKTPGGGAAVEWHQDWAFNPYTKDDMLAVGAFWDYFTGKMARCRLFRVPTEDRL